MVDVSVAIILDTRRVLKNGTYPVKLRLTHNRKQKYYKTDYDLSPEDFEKVIDPKPRGVYKDIKIELEEAQQSARVVLKNMSIFSFELFEKKFKDQSRKGEFFAACEQNIKRLETEGRINHATTFKSTLSSFKSFTKKKELPFIDITIDFLKRYEKWMLDQGKKAATIGIYLRNVKVLFNEQIELGHIEKELYPFGRRKYIEPASRNIKKALGEDDILKILEYQPVDEREEKAKDFWLFSYYCHGINIKDMCLLKYKNINSDSIVFIRAKTERATRGNSKPIEVALKDYISAIIKRWGNKPTLPDTYVFPILSQDLSPEQETVKIKQATKTINKYMKRIGEALGIKQDVTTYAARHSFATMLKLSGAPFHFISEALGHTNFKTTENYMNSFDNETKRRYTDALIPSKKK